MSVNHVDASDFKQIYRRLRRLALNKANMHVACSAKSKIKIKCSQFYLLTKDTRKSSKHIRRPLDTYLENIETWQRERVREAEGSAVTPGAQPSEW